MRRKIDPAAGAAALDSWAVAQASAAAPVDTSTVATAVRYSLEELATRQEGRAVEVRVPPFGVVQCIAGPEHTRGTPANVIETDPETWLALVTGRETFAQAVARGEVLASGVRADLSDYLPLD